VAKHRFLDKKISIPINSLRRALRRIAYVKYMDIANVLDYVIVGKFPQLKELLKISTGKEGTHFIGSWKKYVQERLGNLIVARRLNISAPGTCLLAFYSSIPAAPPGVTWTINVPSQEAMLLTLWFNSSLNIIQMLIRRKETGGAYLQIDEYTLEKLKALNPTELSSSERKMLLGIFEQIKNEEFPGILEQLKTRFLPRIKIDKAIMKVLGFADEEIEKALNFLYPALANEIEQLKALMKG